MKKLMHTTPTVWLYFIVISVISISVVAIASLVLDVFSPKITVFAAMAIAVPIFYFSRHRLGDIEDIHGVGLAALAAVVFLALIFRVEPYPWINGGQDQGVYVNMSSYYQHGGGIFIEDSVLPKLTNDDLKKAYTLNLPAKTFQPGVYYGGEKDYYFQFYHLHPLWMAVFAEFFGDDARGYALTFFSILSIIFLMLLTFELSGARIAAICVGLLMAINPLHVFFSKWPVTEVVALAFSSMSFYYLARAHREANSQEVAQWSLFISCISLSLLFFVRISGFFYLPLLATIFMAGSWQYKIKQNRFGVDLMLFAFACIAFYVLSVFYGLKYSTRYSNDIYHLTFGRFMGGQWRLVMATGLVTMLAVMSSWHLLLGKPTFVAKISNLVRSKIMIFAVFLVMAVGFGLSLYKLYKVGFSDAYSSDPGLGIRWGLSGSAGEAVVRSSVINWLIYTSPILLFFGGVAMLRRKSDFRLALVLVMIGVPLATFVVSNPILPYQYYFARYLVSESVPYAIVACVVAMFSGVSQSWSRLGIVAVVLTIPLFGYYTLKQLGAEEGVRPLNIFRKIATHVDENDVLLIEPVGWSIPRVSIETPLRFYFGIKTFVLPAKERDAFGKQLSKSFRNVWLLSPKVINDDRFVLEERLLHYDKVVERVGHIPQKIIEGCWRQELLLYSLKKPGYPSSRGESCKIDFGRYEVSQDSYEISSILGDGWHGIESSHVWSAEKAVIRFNNTMFKGDKLPSLMKMEITPFAATNDRPVTVEVHAGGRRFEFDYTNSMRNIIEIPGVCAENQGSCRIEFLIKNASSPQILGQSADDRLLGFALYAVLFE